MKVPDVSLNSGREFLTQAELQDLSSPLDQQLWPAKELNTNRTDVIKTQDVNKDTGKNLEGNREITNTLEVARTRSGRTVRAPRLKEIFGLELYTDLSNEALHNEL